MSVLKQVRVLDLSPYLPSQYCSFLLARLGAEVILVERPEQRAEAFSSLSELINCDKKSVQLDLKSESGREVFYRLAGISDVILEGFRPGVAQHKEKAYENIKSIKSDISASY